MLVRQRYRHTFLTIAQHVFHITSMIDIYRQVRTLQLYGRKNILIVCQLPTIYSSLPYRSNQVHRFLALFHCHPRALRLPFKTSVVETPNLFDIVFIYCIYIKMYSLSLYLFRNGTSLFDWCFIRFNKRLVARSIGALYPFGLDRFCVPSPFRVYKRNLRIIPQS